MRPPLDVMSIETRVGIESINLGAEILQFVIMIPSLDYPLYISFDLVVQPYFCNFF